MPGLPATREQTLTTAVAGDGTDKAPAEDDATAAWLEGIDHAPLRDVLAGVRRRDPGQHEFLSAVKEVAQSLAPVFEQRPELLKAFEMICEPERQVVFRVPWLDDSGELRVNRGFRVQFSSAIGPYKGGLRFRRGVNLSIVKMLGFEQIFKNALTTLPMGAGKGGSDFDPKGKSDGEIQRFCQSFMTELYRHIGSHTDIPAGDIGVGAKEIGFLFGQYKRITALHTGSVTGKAIDFGGSECRPEATGYGLVRFAMVALADAGEEIKGKRCVVSGSGNVARYCVEKLLDEGAVVLGVSDSQGYIYEPQGLTPEQLEQITRIKGSHDGRLQEYQTSTGRYVGEGRKIWELDAPVDAAFPCATQDELDLEDAQQLVQHGCKFVFEGANMPCTERAVRYLADSKVVFGPAKAANAGGVAVSGLEMVQNRLGLRWARGEVGAKLKDIMEQIYRTCKAAADEYGVSLAAGANIIAFLKVAEAVLAQGAV